MDNINIWFARNKDGNIVTIDKINEYNRYEEYSCPICESKLIPKLGDINAHHLAHKDVSKCSRETQIHFFVKNELLKQGDRFTIKLDNESKEFICKEILIEQSYKTQFGTYKPDITVKTENNETIYFEIENTNKKKIEEYLDIWMALNNIVVEVKVKELTDGHMIDEFKALFYEEKCFNVNKDESDYYELIGKVKLNKNKYPIEQVNKLDWLWKDINKYLIGELKISELSDLIQSIEDEELRKIVVNILRKNKCTKIIEDYIKYNILKIENELSRYLYGKVELPKCIFDRIYGEYDINLNLNGFPKKVKYNLIKNFDYTNFIKIFKCCEELGNIYSISSRNIYLLNNNLNIYFKCWSTNKVISIDKLDYDYIENSILSMMDNNIEYAEKLEYRLNIKKIKKEIGVNLKRRYLILLYNFINPTFGKEYNIDLVNNTIKIKFIYKNTFEIIYKLQYSDYKRIKTIRKDIKNYFSMEIAKIEKEFNEIDMKSMYIKRNLILDDGWEVSSYNKKDEYIYITIAEKYYKTEYNIRSHRYENVASYRHMIYINMYYSYLDYDLKYIIYEFNNILKNEIYEFNTTNKRSNPYKTIVLEYISELDRLKNKKFEKFDEILKYRFLNKENLHLIRDRIIFINNNAYMIPLSFLKIDDINDRKKFIKNLINYNSIKTNKRKNDKNLKIYVDEIIQHYDDKYDLCRISLDKNILNGCIKIIIQKHYKNIRFEYLIRMYKNKLFVINKHKFLNSIEELKTEIENDMRQNLYNK